MGRQLTLLFLAIMVMAISTLAAVPQQGERPPQPFFQDFYSGSVTLQGAPAPAGTILIGCLVDCETRFQSKSVEIQDGGIFEMLEVNPTDQALIGLPVSFYIINEFGRIKALETADFTAIFDFHVVDLTFTDGLPAPTPIPTVTPTPQPTPTAILPVPGDPAITEIPRLALIIGATAVAVGAGMILLARRRTE